MGALRVAWRLPAIVAVMVGLYVLWFAGRPFAGARADDWRAWIYLSWARATAWIVGMRRTRRGPSPRGPGLLVANHVGYVDVLLLAAETGAVFVSKAEVRGWPLIGLTSRAMGTLFVPRGDKRALAEVNGAIAAALEAGRLVGFFPEGTTTDGETLLPFRPSLFEPAVGGRAPVWCAALRYATRPPAPPASRAVAWFDEPSFVRHALRLLALRRFDAEAVFAAEPVVGADRKELAERAEATVRALWRA